MATTSFGQKFYVASENVDEFISVVTAPPNPEDKPKFSSRQMSKDDLKKYTEAILRKHERL